MAKKRRRLSPEEKCELMAKAQAIIDAGRIDLVEAILDAVWPAVLAKRPELAPLFPDKNAPSKPLNPPLLPSQN